MKKKLILGVTAALAVALVAVLLQNKGFALAGVYASKDEPTQTFVVRADGSVSGRLNAKYSLDGYRTYIDDDDGETWLVSTPENSGPIWYLWATGKAPFIYSEVMIQKRDELNLKFVYERK